MDMLSSMDEMDSMDDQEDDQEDVQDESSPDLPMKPIYFDMEFNEDGRTIELISLGAVTTEGDEFYAISADFNEALVNSWVRENVLPYLAPHLPRYTNATIAKDFYSWVFPNGVVDCIPVFWTYYGAYDWVRLCQCYGPMVNLPEGFPMFTLDLKQELVRLGNPPQPPAPDNEHHALEDAKWNRALHHYLREYEASLLTQHAMKLIPSYTVTLSAPTDID